MEYINEIKLQPYTELVKQVNDLEEKIASMESVNPDYKENNPTSKSYIRNRLFYEEGEPETTYTPESRDINTEKFMVWAGLATPNVIKGTQLSDYLISIELKGGINAEVIDNLILPLNRLREAKTYKGASHVGSKYYISVGHFQYADAVVYIIYDYESYNEVVKDYRHPEFPSNGIYLCRSEYDTFSENVNYTNYTTVKSITKISTLKVHKLDKKFVDYSGVVEKAKTPNSVYYTDSLGNTGMLEYATSPADGDNKRSLVRRNMRGGITIEDKYITEDDDAVNKKYVDKLIPKSCIVLKASDDGGLTINIENQSSSEQGELYFDTERAGDVKLHNIATPTQDKDAANKKYVDDKVKGNTVDEIKYISTWSGEERSLLKLHKDGVIWNDEFLIESAESDMAAGTIYQKIPIVAGENVIFEVDEVNKVVKINAEGGSGGVTSWNDLTDKPFYSVFTTILTFPTSIAKSIPPIDLGEFLGVESALFYKTICVHRDDNAEFGTYDDNTFKTGIARIFYSKKYFYPKIEDITEVLTELGIEGANLYAISEDVEVPSEWGGTEVQKLFEFLLLDVKTDELEIPRGLYIACLVYGSDAIGIKQWIDGEFPDSDLLIGQEQVHHLDEKFIPDNFVTKDELEEALAGVGGTGGGTTEAIIDVTSLPTENINEKAFYRLLTGSFVFNQYVQSTWICHCVDTLPEVGIVGVGGDLSDQSKWIITAYYNVTDGGVYAYVDDMIGSIFGVPAGWYPFGVLSEAAGEPFSGVITDIMDDPQDNTFRLLLENVIWQYKDGKWNSLKSIGKSGTGLNAEVFNHPSNEASGTCSHAEGIDTTASGWVSHAEGDGTTASGDYSHAEGKDTTASGYYSHAEGFGTTASAYYSHAEGYDTIAQGQSSHAEGQRTSANGDYSHAEGNSTLANSYSQHVQGTYNIEDNDNKYAHIVGNGVLYADGSVTRSNAHTLDWQGNAWYAGEVFVGGTGQDDKNTERLVRLSELNAIVGDIETALNSIIATQNSYIGGTT